MLSTGVSINGFRIFSTLRETPAGTGANISNAPLYGDDDGYVSFGCGGISTLVPMGLGGGFRLSSRIYPTKAADVGWGPPTIL